ncbi:hypothetical protein M2T82_00765 [Elizabethkingia ursingii]|uniref:hypothetical protein n=1 Tax=Elizabethkingia ursingii TaxID=1756150 RepID=UPI002011FA36|nr:hypothetical protein [Elizabethkingia ursingii]MCL1666585.1 hypothetical protein [Elizabethkingia ursingii]
MYNDPSGEWVAFLIGSIVGRYLSGVQANNGNWNPVKWDWKNTWTSVVGGAFAGGGFGEGTYNSAILGSEINSARENWNLQQARSRYYEAEANCSTCQDIKAFERFLFIDIPLSFAGGELFEVGWRAVGAGKYLGQAWSYVTKGGSSFAEYKALKGGTQTLYD